MKRILPLLCLAMTPAVVALASALTSVAQEQTSAPPGVPVSPVPGSPTVPVTGDDAGRRVFQVRLVDGRNGSPLAKARVTVWYDEPSGDGIVLETNEGGVAAMPAPLGLPVRVLLGVRELVDCRKILRDAPPPAYNMQSIAVRGVHGENVCGTAAVKPAPGEVVLYARPLRWYEGLNR